MSDHPDELVLSMYADGELPVDDVPALEAHLATCPECRTVVDETQWFSGLLKAANARRNSAKAAFDPEALAMLLAEHPQQPRSAAVLAPEAASGQLIRPPRSRWQVPLIISGAAAVVVLASLAVMCGGVGGLAACTGGKVGPGGWIAAGGGATAVPRYGAGGETPAETVIASATTASPYATGAPYPGATFVDSVPFDIAETATALAVVHATGQTGTPGPNATSAGYPPPATRTPTPAAPVRLTRAAVMAGLATDVAEGVAVSVWLPLVGAGR